MNNFCWIWITSVCKPLRPRSARPSGVLTYSTCLLALGVGWVLFSHAGFSTLTQGSGLAAARLGAVRRGLFIGAMPLLFVFYSERRGLWAANLARIGRVPIVSSSHRLYVPRVVFLLSAPPHRALLVQFIISLWAPFSLWGCERNRGEVSI